MSSAERGGLKAAFAGFGKPESDNEAELKLLGRTVAAERSVPKQHSGSLEVATNQLPAISGLTPRPLLEREAVRQLSFRCPVSIASELRRKAAFNQLEQQEIIVAGIRRVLAELEDPPAGWER